MEGRRYFPKWRKYFDDRDFILNDVFGPTDREKAFSKKDKVVCIGSCFAGRLAFALNSAGCNVEYTDTQSGLENTFSLRNYIEEEDITCDLLVVTLGLSEVWKNADGVIYRGAASYKDAHCVQTSVEENLENLHAIAKWCRSRSCTFVLTLSPVPLNATFMDRPAIVSDCVSKSTLRVAIDLLCKEYPEVIYWPSFEFIRSVPPHSGVAVFGDRGFARDIPLRVSKIIIRRFLETYCD